MNTLLQLIVSIALPFLAGAVGSQSTVPNLESWYDTLNKPVFNPPSSIFGPVWTVLYLLIGIALYLTWRQVKTWREKPVIFFFLNLVLNAGWSIAFFGAQSPLLGMLVIIPLIYTTWVIISMTMKINKTAAYLLVPYLLWGCFAAVLNFSILILN